MPKNPPHDVLRAAVNRAIAYGSPVFTEQRPYFCEGSDALVALEGMVDRVGLRNVLYALEKICYGKAEHLESNWQDKPAAREWTQNGRVMYQTANKV